MLALRKGVEETPSDSTTPRLHTGWEELSLVLAVRDMSADNDWEPGDIIDNLDYHVCVLSLEYLIIDNLN